jgi:hypothetical protein
MRGSACDESLSEVEGRAWRAFKTANTNILAIFNAENYNSLAEELLSACKIIGCKASLIVHFLDFLYNKFGALLLMSMGNAFIKKLEVEPQDVG